jgi:hypothetical protein
VTILQKIRQMQNLEDFAEADGFEYTGDGLILFFVAQEDDGKVQRDFVLCTTAREARREIKTRQAAGWKCCWKVFGRLHLPMDVSEFLPPPRRGGLSFVAWSGPLILGPDQADVG